MLRMGGPAVVAATFFVAMSGSAMLAAANPAGMAMAQASESAAQKRTREDCIRDGGWYVKDVGVCEYESKAKAAAALERDQQACQQNGGYWATAAGVCEFEAKDRAKR